MWLVHLMLPWLIRLLSLCLYKVYTTWPFICIQRFSERNQSLKITWWRAFVTAFWSTGSDKKKTVDRSVRDPPISSLRTSKNTSKNNCGGNGAHPRSSPSASCLYFGRIRSTGVSHSTCLKSEKILQVLSSTLSFTWNDDIGSSVQPCVAIQQLHACCTGLIEIRINVWK